MLGLFGFLHVGPWPTLNRPTLNIMNLKNTQTSLYVCDRHTQVGQLDNDIHRLHCT
jgi:hypothetical protein